MLCVQNLLKVKPSTILLFEDTLRQGCDITALHGLLCRELSPLEAVAVDGSRVSSGEALVLVEVSTSGVTSTRRTERSQD